MKFTTTTPNREELCRCIDFPGDERSCPVHGRHAFKPWRIVIAVLLATIISAAVFKSLVFFIIGMFVLAITLDKVIYG